MKKVLLLLMLVLVPTLLMAQAAGGAVKRPVKKTESVKRESKKQESKKQQTKKKDEPQKQEEKRQEVMKSAEEAGYDVTFDCNVPSATLSIDGTTSGTASGTRFLKTGSHSVRLTANGYEPLAKTINVSRSSTSFSFTMKREESKLSPVLQNLINNMVSVEGGTFTMGATSKQGKDAAKIEKPAHQVTLSSFSIGKYEVTQEEWEAVMVTNPSIFKGDRLPVESVSWEDCQEFIRKLNALTGRCFRLPTEAEWEYAARGGNRSRGYKYAGSNIIDDVAWFWENSGNHRLSGEWSSDIIKANNCQTHPVGQKLPNELGLYDMSGNVYEWCQDWYGSYSSSAQTNPTGASSGSGRVIRGSSWLDSEGFCRSLNRGNCTPSLRGSNLGLRLAL